MSESTTVGVVGAVCVFGMAAAPAPADVTLQILSVSGGEPEPTRASVL